MSSKYPEGNLPARKIKKKKAETETHGTMRHNGHRFTERQEIHEV